MEQFFDWLPYSGTAGWIYLGTLGVTLFAIVADIVLRRGDAKGDWLIIAIFTIISVAAAKIVPAEFLLVAAFGLPVAVGVLAIFVREASLLPLGGFLLAQAILTQVIPEWSVFAIALGGTEIPGGFTVTPMNLSLLLLVATAIAFVLDGILHRSLPLVGLTAVSLVLFPIVQTAITIAKVATPSIAWFGGFGAALLLALAAYGITVASASAREADTDEERKVILARGSFATFVLVAFAAGIQALLQFLPVAG